MSRPTTRAGREAKAQLNAYARWNPENDSERIERLAELQASLDEGRAFQFGRAIVANSYNVSIDQAISREYIRQRLSGISLGRALIVGRVRATRESLDDTPTHTIGDGVYIMDGAQLELRDNVFLSHSTFSKGVMSIVGSIVEGCDIADCDIRQSDISNSVLNKCEVNNSTISLSELDHTKVMHGTLVNVVGSSDDVYVGGRIIDAEMFYAGAHVGFQFVGGTPEA